jgi:hypothetical protein
MARRLLGRIGRTLDDGVRAAVDAAVADVATRTRPRLARSRTLDDDDDDDDALARVVETRMTALAEEMLEGWKGADAPRRTATATATATAIARAVDETTRDFLDACRRAAGAGAALSLRERVNHLLLPRALGFAQAIASLDARAAAALGDTRCVVPRGVVRSFVRSFVHSFIHSFVVAPVPTPFLSLRPPLARGRDARRPPQRRLTRAAHPDARSTSSARRRSSASSRRATPRRRLLRTPSPRAAASRARRRSWGD